MTGTWLRRLDAAFFVLGGASSIWLAYLTLDEGIRPGWPLLLLIVFWALVAYLVLPRLHRILTRIYVPDYFIGRTRTADGLLGDPVNLAFLGTASQVRAAMERAGWSSADPLSLSTGLRIVTRILGRESYPEAPVSPLLLFGRQQDFAYQQQVAGNPSQRHHVRFWECPHGWLLPGGFAVDWLAAGTFDQSVGLSLFTFQVTHKIDADVDVERDHIVATVRDASPEVTLSVLRDFSTGYHSRNGGGDVMRTDGDLPILDVRALPTPAPVATELASSPAATGPAASGPAASDLSASVRRPSQLLFATAVTALRGAVHLLLAALVFTGHADAAGALALVTQDLFPALGVGYLAAGIIDLVLALALYAGRNSARLLVCALSLAEIVSSAAAAPGTLNAALVPVAISVLLLLSLSSDAAREFTVREDAETPGD